MQTITAIFEDGVLKPTQPLELPASTEVCIIVRVLPKPRLTVGGLNTFLRSLPALGDDAEAFAKDIRDIRASFPPEVDPWE